MLVSALITPCVLALAAPQQIPPGPRWAHRRFLETTVLSLDTVAFACGEGSIALAVRETGGDLNGDGDTDDVVLHHHDGARRVITNLGVQSLASQRPPSLRLRSHVWDGRWDEGQRPRPPRPAERAHARDGLDLLPTLVRGSP